MARSKIYAMVQKNASSKSAETPKKKSGVGKKVANTEKRLARLEREAYRPGNTTQGKEQARITKEVASRAARINVNAAGPVAPRRSILTPAHSVQESFEKGLIPDAPPIICNNVEPTVKSRSFTTFYNFQTQVATNTTRTVFMSSAAHSYSDQVDTPKAFRTNLVSMSASQTVVPGPCNFATAGPSYAGRPVWHADATGSQLVLQYGSAIGAAATPVNPSLDAPFFQVATPAGASATALRWMLKRLRLRVLNTTPMANRGSVGHLLIPMNGFPEASPGTVSTITLANYGLYRVYSNGETARDGKAKWITLSFRNSQRAYHAVTEQTTSNWGQAAAMFLLDNQSGATQTYDVQIEMVWSLAGNTVRGLDTAHVNPPGLSDTLKAVNDLRLVTNHLPGDEKGRESLHEIVALASDAGLHASIPSPAKRLMEAVGSHAVKLAEHGVASMFEGASEALGGVFAPAPVV